MRITCAFSNGVVEAETKAAKPKTIVNFREQALNFLLAFKTLQGLMLSPPSAILSKNVV